MSTTLTIPRLEMSMTEGGADELAQLGLIVEPFGGGAVLVRETVRERA
jgi:hypothetical protein